MITLHERILAFAILGRIALLLMKFAFLVMLKQSILVWLKKPVDSDRFSRQIMSLFGRGIIHIATLLVSPSTGFSTKLKR